MFSYLSINFLAPLLISGILFIPFVSKNDNNVKKSLTVGSLRDTSTSLMSAILIITLFTYLGGILNLSIPTTSFLLMILFLIIILVRIYFQKFYFLNSKLYLLLFASTAGFLQYLPVLLQNSKKVNGLGMISKGNNDIASYAATVSEFLKSGFVNSQRLQDLDLNSFALTRSYQTPNSLLVFTSTVFHQKPYVITIPLMIFAITFCIIAIATLTQSTWPRISVKQALLIGWFVNSLAITTYIQSHYFLGQIIALGVSAMILESAFKVLADNALVKKRVIEVGVIVALSIYSYPTILIPFLGIVYLTFMLYLILSASDKKVAKVKTLILGTSLGILLSLPYIKTAISLGISQSGKIAGWRLFNVNPFNWMIGSVDSPTTMNIWASLLIWILFVSVALAIIGVSLRRAEGSTFVLVITSIFILVYLLFIASRGNDYLAYSSWKLLSTLFPFLVAILSGAILYFYRMKFPLYVIATIAIIYNPISLWSTGYISTSDDDLEIQTNTKVLSQGQLKIDLIPYFQTMQIASLLQDSKLHFKSLSYWPSSEGKPLCTLVSSQNTNYDYKFNINESYALASNSQNGCKEVGSVLEYNMDYDYSNLETFLSSGFSGMENWGVWTDSKKASLVFKAEEPKSKFVSIKIKTQAFLSKTFTQNSATILLNGKKIGNVNYSLLNSSNEMIIQIPAMSLNSNNLLNSLSFIMKSTASPSSLNLSGDTRELGIGLISIRFETVD